MFFYVLATLHLLTAFFWVGGAMFMTAIIFRESDVAEMSGSHFAWLKKTVHRFRLLSLVASLVLFGTGLLMLPELSFNSKFRIGSLSTLIVGWIFMTALVAGTYPSISYSSRPEDIQQKEEEEWNLNRLFWIHLVSSILGIFILISGVLLVYTQ